MPAAVLDAVEWLALGFEIIDCPYPDWKFQPPTSSPPTACTPRWSSASRSSGGRHGHAGRSARRVQGEAVEGRRVVAEGSGKNSLRSPALCLAELASALERAGLAPLAAGDLVSSGTLTESQPIAAGQRWTARLEGCRCGR